MPGPVTLRANSLRSGSTLPSTCAPGDCFIKTSGGSEGQYVSITVNTWLLLEAASGAGTVTSVSVTTANGISGVVANPTTTPAITFTLGAITPTTVNGNTLTTGTYTLTGAAGKTLTFLKTISFTAADDTGVYTLPTGTKTLLATDGSGAGLSGVTLSAVIPNTAPSSGQVLAGNAGGTAYAPVSLSGDATLTSAGALTLASTITAGGPIGSATVAPIITYDAKGRLTTVTSATITPAVGSVTGLGTGVATALAVNTGSAGAFVVNGGVLGTPSSGVATNLTGTASGLTAGNVTTNANLTGDVTSVGNATTLTNAPVIAKVLTGYVSGAGTVAATDTILQAFQKLNGNDALKASLASPTFTGTVTIPTGAQITKPNIIGTATNDNASAGSVGEYVEGNLASGSSVTLTTATGKTVISISLTAGDWDISTIAYFTTASTTSITRLASLVSETDNTFSGTNYTDATYPSTVMGVGDTSFTGPRVRKSYASTTTVYLVVYATFGVSTLKAWGSINARRVR